MKQVQSIHKLLVLFSFIFLFTFFNCSKDDDGDVLSDASFLSGALTSATSQQLEGRWAIFQIEFENEITDIPESFPECGRDFFDFQNSGDYREYIFDDNFECTPEINMLSWTLSNGIITVSDGISTDRWVITELTQNRLVFKLQFDADSDGNLEIFTAICNRYTPPVEMDIYSGTFYWDNTIENLDKIALKWDGYRGYNQFEKYEIYRLDEGCNDSNPVLIASITDVNENTFIDITPPPYDTICYVFKIYTNEGLLGESSPVIVDTSFLEIPNINLSEPVLINSMVDLNWEQYQGYYFSHYEIAVRNYSSGSGAYYQEDQLLVINDIETLNATVELPYFSNPVFVVHVYNIFGKRNQYVIEGQNQQSTNFVRDEILPIDFIKFTAFSPNETVLYFADYSDIYKFNYSTNTVEYSVNLNSSSTIFIKVFESSFGTEVIVNDGGAIRVYDSDLNFKYNLETSIFAFNPDHLAVNEDGYWLMTDRENLYSFSRTDDTLDLISTNALYNQGFSTSTIKVTNLGQNRILAGNQTQSQGLIVGIDSNGVLSNEAVSVDLNLISQRYNNPLFSESQEYFVNKADNTLYSTDNFNLITTMSPNYFPSGISNDGTLILGTNNNPEYSDDNFYEKKVRPLSFPALNELVYNSKGYPIILYQNHLGQLVSISKGLPGSLGMSTPENDVFIEIIQ